MISFRQYMQEAAEPSEYEVRQQYKYGKDGNSEVRDGYMVMRGYSQVEWFKYKSDALKFVKDAIAQDKKDAK